MTKALACEISADIVTITFDLPDAKVNILSPAVMTEFSELLEQLAANTELLGVIVISGKENNFIAGADISVIENISSEGEGELLAARGQEIFNRLAQLPCPTVAAINGSCLGGGTELALACTYRVISDNPGSFMGLPETQLGIIPGFGGTQRLPVLVGLGEAIRMITTGARVQAGQARRIGLVDEVVPVEYLRQAALRIISNHQISKKACGRCLPTLPTLLDRLPFWQKIVFRKARRLVNKKAGDHYPALAAAVDTIEAGVRLGLAKGLAYEARTLGRLAVTSTAKNLQKVFRLREHFSKVVTGSDRFQNIGVVGAGIMGGGIVALVAEKGLEVRLINRSTKGLKTAMGFLAAHLGKKQARHIYSRPQADLVRNRVTYDTVMRGMGEMDVVIEAVVEKMEVKQEILARISEEVSGSTLILSNTSSLSISEMAQAVPGPERVAGLHFFNPVDRMPLVEVIHGEMTSPETIDRVMAFAGQIGKIPVSVKDRPGFLVNRLLLPYLNEAARILEEGSDISQIDHALKNFGMPMGPFQLLDMVGLDIADHVADILHQGFGDRMLPSPILAAMQDAGRLGRKSNSGFYLYDKSGRGTVDPQIMTLLKLEAPDRQTFKDEEIVNRLLLPMINEAVFCLEEDVISEARAVDAAMIFGAGFPPYTGGLIRYCDALGARRIVRDLDKLAAALGPRFLPAGLLRRMAELDASFYESGSQEK